MGKPDNAGVAWHQAPDGSWHPVAPAANVTVNNNGGGCLRAIGGLVAIVVLLGIGVFVLGALSSSGSANKTTTTTTSTTVTTASLPTVPTTVVPG